MQRAENSSMRKGAKIKLICKNMSLLFAMLCVVSGIFGVSQCYAAEGEESTDAGTSVTYFKSENEKFPLHVEVTGGGELNENGAVIRNKTVDYELEYGTQKTFQIDSDFGHSLKKVTLNDEDITDTIEENIITVQGVDYEQNLKVSFQSAFKGNAGTDPGGKGNIVSKLQSVKTGDIAGIGAAVAALLFSLFIFFVYKRKKTKENQV